MGMKTCVLLSLCFVFSNCVDNDESVVYNAKDEKHIDLFPGEVLLRAIPPNVTVVLTVQKVSPTTSFLVCQAHIQYGNLTLSLDATQSVGKFVTGSDIGVVTVLEPQQNKVSWYLFSKLDISVNTLFYVTALNENDTLPGGCNQEFDMENDPNIHIEQNAFWHNVIFQWSNIGFSRMGIPPNCEDYTKQDYLEYEMYAYYLKEGNFQRDTYLEGMKKMLKPEDIMLYGVKVKSLLNNKLETSNATIAGYSRQGVIYGVVVRGSRQGKITHAAYISRSTYSCNVADSSCEHIDAGSMVLATFGGIIGIFLLFLGHRFFKTENFIFGFLAFALIFYIVFAVTTEESNTVCLVLAGVFGLVGGFLWLAFWWNCGFPLVSVLLIGLVAGFLFSSVLFYTPFGNLSYWQSEFNYGMTFACACLILPVILMCYTRFLNIFACAFVGSFGVVLAIDHYLFGGMKMILINSIRHATVPEYYRVFVLGPYQTNDIILTVVWLLLMVIGIVFQLYRERTKAPFPPCPRKVNRRYLQPLTRHLRQTSDDNDDRQSLVPDTTPHYNQYVAENVHIPEEPCST
ncbi:hypothetical protein ScPMuIL_015715 [Solemya velum]